MQELAAAEDAKKVIDTLSAVSPDSWNTLEALHRAYDRAKKANSPTISSGDLVNAAARNKALLALNDVIGSLQARSLTPAKINRGKVALDAWIKLLKGRAKHAPPWFARLGRAARMMRTAVTDKLARRATQPAARQRPRPDAEIVGEEVSSSYASRSAGAHADMMQLMKADARRRHERYR
jgi:hypothetical protein